MKIKSIAKFHTPMTGSRTSWCNNNNSLLTAEKTFYEEDSQKQCKNNILLKIQTKPNKKISIN